MPRTNSYLMGPSGLENIKETILHFAGLFDRYGTVEPPMGLARENEWIDADGMPTEDGRRLVEALAQQSGTRTAFRSLG